ncbi:MAG: ABC transporter permease subunit [Candidatus Heimdallarchaeota archaeon]
MRLGLSKLKIFKISWNEMVTNRKGILLFIGLMTLFIVWFLTLFDGELFAEMEAVFESYPDIIKDMVGGQISIASFGGFINTYIFEFSWMYFGIYVIMKASQDIPKEIEDKTIDLIMAKPINRWEFVIGKYFRHIGVAFFLSLCTALGIMLGIFTFPNINPAEIYLDEVMFVVFWFFLFLVALISTGFLFSTFLSTKKALGAGFGMLVFFFAFGSFWGAMPEIMENVKFLSIFYYFDPFDLLVNHNWGFVWLDVLVLGLYSVIITIFAGCIFNKRDIPV